MKRELSANAIEAFEELLTITMDVGSFLDDGTDDAVAVRRPMLAELVAAGVLTVENGNVQISAPTVSRMLSSVV